MMQEQQFCHDCGVKNDWDASHVTSVPASEVPSETSLQSQSTQQNRKSTNKVLLVVLAVIFGLATTFFIVSELLSTTPLPIEQQQVTTPSPQLDRIHSSTEIIGVSSDEAPDVITFFDEKTGATFDVPSSWQRMTLSVESPRADIQFKSSDGSFYVSYWREDLWNEMSNEERERAEFDPVNVDRNFINQPDLIERMGVSWLVMVDPLAASTSGYGYGSLMWNAYSPNKSQINKWRYLWDWCYRSETWEFLESSRQVEAWLFRIDNGFLYTLHFTGREDRLYHDFLLFAATFEGLDQRAETVEVTPTPAIQTLRVAADSNNLTKLRDSNGNITGFGVDLMEALAKEMGHEIVFVEADWDAMLGGISRGTGDFDLAMSGITITDERAEMMDFSNPYFIWEWEIEGKQGVDALGAIFPKGSDELVNEFNAALATVIADGTYEDIYARWFDGATPALLNTSSSP